MACASRRLSSFSRNGPARSRRWNPLNARWRALPGYLRPDDFLAMFRYVREKAYESKSFRDFVKALPS